MSEASDKLALFLATEHESLAKALQEMAAFEQALGSQTAFYVYPLTPTNRLRAEKAGLIVTKSESTKIRLTRYGREVVNSLDVVTEMN